MVHLWEGPHRTAVRVLRAHRASAAAARYEGQAREPRRALLRQQGGTLREDE
jgi:hypothetical protein